VIYRSKLKHGKKKGRAIGPAFHTEQEAALPGSK